MGPLTAILTVALALAASPGQHDHKAMNERGNQAMGFDQAKATHTFTTTAAGGVIAVDAKEPSDATTIGQIRAHLGRIAKLFKAGDFSKPLFIHAQTPPGADIMKARRQQIEYRYEDTTSGGKVTITSGNHDAIAAVHRFLLFQNQEHVRQTPG